LLCGFSFTAAAALTGNKTQARLLLSAETARPGETVMAGIELRMPPGWHTYWRNPGESGKPTTVEWELPPGVTAGEILWPPPERFLETEFTTYIYHDQAVLLVPLKLAIDRSRGKLDLQAKVSWLECEKACVPGSAKVKASLTVGDTSTPSKDAKLIEDGKGKLPRTDPSLAVRALWDGSPAEDTRALILEWVTTETVTAPDFYPYPSDAYEILPSTEQIPADPGKIWLRKKVKKTESAWPTQIQGLLVGNPKGPRPSLAHEVKLTIEGPKGPAGAAASTTPVGSKSQKTPDEDAGVCLSGRIDFEHHAVRPASHRAQDFGVCESKSGSAARSAKARFDLRVGRAFFFSDPGRADHWGAKGGPHCQLGNAILQSPISHRNDHPDHARCAESFRRF
jgi:thiol:disulfide interchange protein DsbD